MLSHIGVRDENPMQRDSNPSAQTKKPLCNFPRRGVRCSIPIGEPGSGRFPDAHPRTSVRSFRVVRIQGHVARGWKRVGCHYGALGRENRKCAGMKNS